MNKKPWIDNGLFWCWLLGHDWKKAEYGETILECVRCHTFDAFDTFAADNAPLLSVRWQMFAWRMWGYRWHRLAYWYRGLWCGECHKLLHLGNHDNCLPF